MFGGGMLYHRFIHKVFTINSLADRRIENFLFQLCMEGKLCTYLIDDVLPCCFALRS